MYFFEALGFARVPAREHGEQFGVSCPGLDGRIVDGLELGPLVRHAQPSLGLWDGVSLSASTVTPP